MSQQRVYAPQPTITAGEPARIDGGFLLESGITCPVEVRVTLRVPSGITITGGSDWQSAGAGLVTTTFTVRPGGGVKDVSANVFASKEIGEARVTSDFSYFPVGHPELKSEIDGTTMVFDVEEPNPPPEPTPTGSDSSGGSGQPSTPQSTPSTPVNPGPGPIVSFIIAINKSPLFVLGGIAALAIVAIIFVSPKFKIGIRK
jgi:hypothetical protein